jgi:lipopolysaccharide transport system permease protein
VNADIALPIASPDAVVDIEPSTGLRPINVRELWAYRELLYFLVWRDIKVRYKQTALGAVWAILQPVMTMAVFAVFLGRLAHVPSDGLPYPLFSFAGLVPWTYFATAVSTGALSIVGSQNLISKVYFPRLLIPLSSAVTPLVDSGITMLTLAAMLIWYRVVPGAAVMWLPMFVLLAFATAFATGLWLSTLTVLYRDVRHLVGFLMQFWMFATPVAYPASLVPEKWRVVYGLNPMTGVVEGFRWALVGGPAPGPIVAASAAVVIVMLVTGVMFFRRSEGTFADVI